MSRSANGGEPKARRRRMKPWRIALIVGEVLVLLVLVGTLWYRWRVDRHLEAARAAVEEHLGPARPGAYSLREVPGHRNAFTWLTAGSRAIDLTAGFEDLRKLADRPEMEWPSEPAIEELMEHHRGALELLHAGGELPDAALGIDYAEGRATPIPNFVGFNNASRLLLGHARWSWSKQDQQAALDSLRSLAVIVNGLEQEPLLVGQFLGSGAERRLHHAVTEMLETVSGGGVDSEHLGELDRLLSGLPEPIDYPRALGVEAASALQSPRVASTFLNPWAGATHERWRLRSRFLRRLCSGELALRYAEIGRRSEETYVTIRPELWNDIDLVGSAERHESWVGRLCLQELTWMDTGPDIPLVLRLTESSRRLVRVGLELAKQARETGRYPADLSGIAAAARRETTAGELPLYEVRADGSVSISYPAVEALAAAEGGLASYFRLELPPPATGLPSP